MKGYARKILRINLSKEKISEEVLNTAYAEGFIGGRGLGAKMLYDELSAGIDPLSPSNKLCIFSGPLAGTAAPTSSGCAIITKSPLTGIYNSTIFRGHFPSELKSTGYDGIIVEGRAKQMVYVWVDDEKVEIKECNHLRGMSTSDTQRAIKEEIGEEKAKVMCIGPAGERLVKFACIISNRRAAGRGGAGAVMGSKNLKAIALRGTKKTEVADEDSLKEVAKEMIKRMREKCKGYTQYGSSQLVSVINELGIFPTRNYQESAFEGAHNVSAETLNETLVVGRKTCPTCPIGCIRISQIRNGKYAGSTSEGPEYETIWAFGPQCGNSCLESIVYAEMLCDDLGLDTITTGVVIGFAMELYERGIIKRHEADIELKFGNHEAMVDMIPKIAFRRGFGDVLAEGVRKAAEKIGKGTARYAMHVKGLELPAYDPRGLKGMGLNYATACRGGCHNKGWTIAQEVFGGKDRFTTDGKAELVKSEQDKTAVYDSAITCLFAGAVIGIQECSRLLTAVTGHDFSVPKLLTAGERIINMERLFNLREGITRKDDTLPERLLKEPIPKGPSAGSVVELNPMLEEYYRIRGWNSEGAPTERKLKELRL